MQRWPQLTSSQWQNACVPGPLSGDGRDRDTPGPGNTTPTRTLSPGHSLRYPRSHDIKDLLGFPGRGEPLGQCSECGVRHSLHSPTPTPQGRSWHCGLKFHMHFSSLPRLQELLDSQDCAIVTKPSSRNAVAVSFISV